MSIVLNALKIPMSLLRSIVWSMVSTSRKHCWKLFRSVLIILIIVITGCAATQTALQKRNLEVQTKMSASIFLDPVPEPQKTILLQIRNTSDQPLNALPTIIEERMKDKGYRIVESLEKAHYLLQVNVLQVGRSNLRETSQILERGFGGAIIGAAVGSVSSKKAHRQQGAVVGGLAGAAIATVANALVEDVTYTVISDVQVSEHLGHSIEVKQKTRARLKQGIHGTQEMIATEKVNWKRYQTRIVSTATQVNLKFQKAEPILINGLSRSVTGLF